MNHVQEASRLDTPASAAANRQATKTPGRLRRAWHGLAATALLLQLVVAAPLAGAQDIVAPAGPDRPAPKAAFPIVGAGLTGGPYLDLILATQYQHSWSDAGSGSDYDGVFSWPTNLPPGYYPLGSFGHGNMSWSDKSIYPSPPSLGNFEAKVMLVAKELKPGYLRAPIGYRHVWNDSGSGSDDDGAMWEPIPADGYVCLGTVATNNNDGQVPALDAMRCVWNTLVVEGRIALFTDKDHTLRTAPFWDTRGTGAGAYFQAVRILPADEHGPAFGIDVGTFRGIATQADANAPAYVINSLAVTKQAPPSAATIESFIQGSGPVIKMHPNEAFLPDSVTAVLDTKTQLCRGVIRNDSSYDDIAFSGVVCNPTSAATLMADDAAARLDPLTHDPDFKTWLNIDDSVVRGNLGRAWSAVRVKSTNQVFVDLQFWIYYPYNGPAKARANVHLEEIGDLLNLDLSTDPTGRHYSDWEYVTLRLARTTAGPDVAFTHVIGSAHDFNLMAETSSPALQWSGQHPILYSALDSHAHFLSAAKHDRGMAFHLPYIDAGSGVILPISAWGILTDYTADGGQVFETWRPGKHFIVSSQWDSIPATNPPWMFFQSRWGQYPKLNFEIGCFTIDPIVYSVQTICPGSIFKEIGSGPSGPITKGSWPDVADTTAPVIQANVVGTLGNAGWYRSNVNVSWAVSDPEGPFVRAGCDPVALTADTARAVVTCTAYSAGGRRSWGDVFKIDRAPPTITAAAAPAPSAKGWNNTNVTVTFTCTDALSGVDLCDSPQVISREGIGVVATGDTVDKAGNHAQATKSLHIDKTAPTTPAGLTATTPAAGRIDLAWTAATDGGSGVAGYALERCAGNGCANFAPIAAPAATSHSDTGLAAGTTYVYRLRAFDAADNAGDWAVASATTLVPAGPSSDLAVTKTDGAANYAPGTSTTYTIVVTNNGPANVTGATVVDPLPAGIAAAAWTCAAAAGSSCGAANGSGSLNTTVNLQNGGTATYTVVAQIGAGATGALVNTVTVAPPAGTTDPTPGNNTATDTDAPALQAASLAVTKAGAGRGTVTGTDIDCGSDCAGSYPGGTVVALTATASPGSFFGNWTGDCASFGTQPVCTLDLTVARNATAWFGTAEPTANGEPMGVRTLPALGDCATDFYIAESELAPGAREGYWGMEVALSKEPRELRGGFNLGGGFDGGGLNPGFGAFFLSFAQKVTFTINAQALAGPIALKVDLLKDNVTRVGGVEGTPTAGAPLVFAADLTPGFYVVQINSTATSGQGSFQLQLYTPGSFAGGVVVGGYLPRDSKGTSLTGFGAFCVPETQPVRVTLFGPNTYGTNAVGNQVMTLRDYQRNVLGVFPTP